MNAQTAAGAGARGKVTVCDVQAVDVHVIDEPHVPHRVLVVFRRLVFIPHRVQLRLVNVWPERRVLRARGVVPVLKRMGIQHI